MKTDNYDQRVRITKIMIRDAYIKLLAEKDIQHITVRELCETAHINRGTFYSHYIDIYDLTSKTTRLVNKIKHIDQVFYNDYFAKNVDVSLKNYAKTYGEYYQYKINDLNLMR